MEFSLQRLLSRACLLGLGALCSIYTLPRFLLWNKPEASSILWSLQLLCFNRDHYVFCKIEPDLEKVGEVSLIKRKFRRGNSLGRGGLVFTNFWQLNDPCSNHKKDCFLSNNFIVCFDSYTKTFLSVHMDKNYLTNYLGQNFYIQY